MSLRDRVVIVTGASSGIGWDAALCFAERGAIVVGVARREERLARLAELCREHSPASGWQVADLGERAAAEGVVRETLARHGRLDVLVNNAAVSKHKHIFATAPEEVERVMRINFMSCVWTTLAAIPAMLRQPEGGSIVNVSSFAARVVPPREPVYAASKAAMNAFTEGLWNELAGTGIHAGLVHPGPIDTEIWQSLEEESGFRGHRFPPRLVSEAILAVVEQRRREISVPRRNVALAMARLLRLVWPSMLLRGMARMDPVRPDVIAAARTRARSDPDA